MIESSLLCRKYSAGCEIRAGVLVCRRLCSPRIFGARGCDPRSRTHWCCAVVSAMSLCTTACSPGRLVARRPFRAWILQWRTTTLTVQSLDSQLQSLRTGESCCWPVRCLSYFWMLALGASNHVGVGAETCSISAISVEYRTHKKEKDHPS